MQLDNRIEDEPGFTEFLELLIASGRLEGPELGVTKQFLEKGLKSLSQKQRHVFEKYVLEENVIEECTRCGVEIPWPEMDAALDNGGLCSWCSHAWEQMMKE
jgi:hypothetical protein